ncbi:MAG TPA: hypothetical protein VK143_11710, partial [Burkholderiales bacterium]|nr:hypothetical protein [Burkholderiales bacterium]
MLKPATLPYKRAGAQSAIGYDEATPALSLASMPASPIYTTPAMRRLEALAAGAPGAPVLMERAGAAAAEFARSLCGDT